MTYGYESETEQTPGDILKRHAQRFLEHAKQVRSEAARCRDEAANYDKSAQLLEDRAAACEAARETLQGLPNPKEQLDQDTVLTKLEGLRAIAGLDSLDSRSPEDRVHA